MIARAIEQAVQHANAAPSYAYPWSELTSDRNDTLLLVGYGSLLNSHSARRTLSVSSWRVPIITYGVRRVFDYIMPVSVRRRYPTPSDDRAYGVLNVYATGKHSDWINGVLTEVAFSELDALREREEGYDLVSVAYSRYPAGDALPSIAYILACPPGDRRTDPSLLPNPGYLKLCLEGARTISDDFATHFLESTYLADKETLLRNWYLPDSDEATH